jgi:hypothetical protein
MSVRRVVQTGTGQTQATELTGSRTGDLAAGRTIERQRKAARSPELIEAVQRLDTTSDPTTAQAIMKWIEEEYERRQGGTLVGLFSRCYLGAPYVDHRLDLSGRHILEHFTSEDSPPVPFQEARPFARNSAYIFVEVYDDGTVVPVRTNGHPVV